MVYYNRHGIHAQWIDTLNILCTFYVPNQIEEKTREEGRSQMNKAMLILHINQFFHNRNSMYMMHILSEFSMYTR